MTRNFFALCKIGKNGRQHQLDIICLITTYDFH